MFVRDKPFQLSLMFVGKARGLHKIAAPENSSLLRKSVNYGRTKFYKLGPVVKKVLYFSNPEPNVIKLLTVVIYKCV